MPYLVRNNIAVTNVCVLKKKKFPEVIVECSDELLVQF